MRTAPHGTGIEKRRLRTKPGAAAAFPQQIELNEMYEQFSCHGCDAVTENLLTFPGIRQ